MNNAYIDLWEFLLLPFYLAAALGVGYLTAPKAERRLFMQALVLRVFGSLFFASIYLFYYKGGDTIAYFLTAKPFVLLFFEQPINAITLLLEPYSFENYMMFNENTGYPLGYIYSDSQTFTVSRVIAPILLLSGSSYIIATVLLAVLSFIGPWKLYELFKDVYPDRKIAAISALFIPSVLFWGAGISKDTVTFTSAMYLIYGFYYTVIKRDINLVRVLGSLVALYFVITIKPYIFVALLPGTFLWLLSAPISRLKNNFLRRFSIPIAGLVSAVLFVVVFQQFNEVLGAYAVDQILEKALVTQDDLKRDYYGGNSFDIGEIDPTIAGVLSKFPIATFYGLYGPTIFNVQNIVMLFSALENSVLAFLTLQIIFRLKFRRLGAIILDSPILLFAISFTLLFAFSIGFTTPNYGAMVRFKIPLLPFFTFFLLVANAKLKAPKTNSQ